MIDSRSKVHPDWVDLATNSIKSQYYPVELIKVNNTDNQHTIGECWNKGVLRASGDWCLFVGDDDYFARDLTATFSMWAELLKDKNPTAISCKMTAFDDDTQRLLHRPFTGMWRKDYLLQHPFNEGLTRGVDREYTNEALKNKQVFVTIPHYYGYYYRQHDEKTCRIVDMTTKGKEIYMQATYANFILPISEKLQSEGYDLHLEAMPFNPNLAKDSKLLWCDWGDVNAVDIGNFNTDAKKILRLHAYEAFKPELHYIPFENFDKVIFVADHIKDYVESKVGQIPQSIVIPNAVDTDKFNFTSKEKNNKIAYLGQIGRKKGIPLMLFLAENIPDYEFHLAGDLIDEDIYYLIKEKNLPNVYLYGKQYNVQQFYSDKTYVLNASPREGNPLAVLEGMACGLKPLVYSWIGADKIYPFTWSTLDQFKDLLNDVNPHEYREWVLDKYDLKDQYNSIKNIIRQYDETN